MAKPGLFQFIFVLSLYNVRYCTKFTIKAQMVCMGFESGTSGSKVQPNPLSYGGPLALAKFRLNITFLFPREIFFNFLFISHFYIIPSSPQAVNLQSFIGIKHQGVEQN